jgi:hypothetical protein
VTAENTLSGTKAAFLASYKVVEIAFLDYAIFSDGIFELAPWPRMEVHGDVRVNDQVRIGARYGLYFYDTLWSADQVDVVPAWGTKMPRKFLLWGTMALHGVFIITEKHWIARSPIGRPILELAGARMWSELKFQLWRFRLPLLTIIC